MRPGEVEAIEPVAKAIFGGSDDVWDRVLELHERHYPAAQRAVAAAYPIIAAAVREQVAQEIRSSARPESDSRLWDPYEHGYSKGIDVAADIVTRKGL